MTEGVLLPSSGLRGAPDATSLREGGLKTPAICYTRAGMHKCPRITVGDGAYPLGTKPDVPRREPGVSALRPGEYES